MEFSVDQLKRTTKGEIYMDQKCAIISYIVWEFNDGGKRTAKGLAEVITFSRAFTAKVNAAKLSTSCFPYSEPSSNH